MVHKEKKHKKSTQENCMWNSEIWLNKVDLANIEVQIFEP